MGKRDVGRRPSLGFIVRRIRAYEGKKLRRIRLEALADSPSAFGSTYEGELGRPADDWNRAAARRADGDTAANFVAESAGSWIGLIGAFRQDEQPDRVDLTSMWVNPEVRRLGVATRLVASVMEWAQRGRASAVELWVTDGNRPALSLYQGIGFAETGARQPLPSDPTKEELHMIYWLRPRQVEKDK